MLNTSARLTFQVPRSVAADRLIRPVIGFVIFELLLLVPFGFWAVSIAGPTMWIPAIAGLTGGLAFVALIGYALQRFISSRSAYCVHLDDSALLVHTLHATHRVEWNDVARVVSMRWMFRDHVSLMLYSGEYIQLSPPIPEAKDLTQALCARTTFLMDAPGLTRDEVKARQRRYARGYRKTQLRYLRYMVTILCVAAAAVSAVSFCLNSARI